MNKPAFLKRQLGASLVALMVGLLISMIAVLGSLTLYQHLTKVSVDATFDAQHNGDTATATLRIQMALQSAGFGLPTPDGAAIFDHLVSTPQEIRWRQMSAVTGGFVICGRILESAATAADLNDTSGQLVGRRLAMTTISSDDDANCDGASDLAGIPAASFTPVAGAATSPVEELLIVSTFNRADQDFFAALQTPNIVSFGAIQTNSCSPYGMTPAEPEHVLITAQYAQSTDLANAALIATRGGAYNLNYSGNLRICVINPVITPAAGPV